MHAEDEFHQQAQWLKTELDQCALTLSAAQQAQLSQLYARVLQWEIDFHSAAYPESAHDYCFHRSAQHWQTLRRVNGA